MRLPASVALCILVSPLATILAWANILRRRDLSPPLKGWWIVLCLLPTVGPLLYLGIGRGKFELTFDRITARFFAIALVCLIVAGVNRMLGSSSHSWQGRQTAFATQVHIPAGAIPYVFNRAWALQYRYTCPGLHAPKGVPPNQFLQPMFRVRIHGARESTDMIDSRGTASQSFRFADGGTYSIRLNIHRGCTWSLWTAAA